MKINVYSTCVLWYKQPGKTLDDGLTIIEEDINVFTMIYDYEGLNVIQLFVEKVQEPLQVVSAKGIHLVPLRVPISSKQTLTWYEIDTITTDEKVHEGMENINEQEIACGERGHDLGAHGDGVQNVDYTKMNHRDEVQNVGDEEMDHANGGEDIRDEERDNGDWDEEDSDDPDYIVDENDDSGLEDADYESDEPRWLNEGLERPEDDDIFAPRKTAKKR
ncbi:hypothetical protein CsSME_00008628 [Camellia sinensis var. sinensis]